MDFLTLMASGFGVGAIVGVTGVGGGSLMTPLLVGVFGLSPAAAIGTDLGYAALTKTGGAWAHARQGHVDRRITLLMLAGSVPASAVTVGLLHAIQLGGEGQAVLRFSLGVALLLTAAVLLSRSTLQALGLRVQRRLTQRQRNVLTVAAGATLGVLVTLSSIGAGALGAALILLLYPVIAPQRLVGTDIAHAVPLTLVAAMGHATLGHVQWELLAWLLAGSLPGIWIGARLSHRLPQQWVRTLLCAALVTAGLKAIA